VGVNLRWILLLLATIGGLIGAIESRRRPAAAAASSTATGPAAPADLPAACDRQREWLLRQLEPGFTAITRPPLVIAGDLNREELERRARETIVPTLEALGRAYFGTPPHEPITLVLLGDQRRYRQCSIRLCGAPPDSSAGHYQRHLRLILVNAAAGDAPLRHELTHALMDFDAPHCPLWLREGLAALHEDCDVDPQRGALQGRYPARAATLEAARQHAATGTLAELLQATSFAGPRQATAYAFARHFCRYLQQRGALAGVYQTLRAAGAADPQGSVALCRLLDQDLAAIEAAFWADWQSATTAAAPVGNAP